MNVDLAPDLAAVLPHEIPTPYGAVEAVEETQELTGEDPATLEMAPPEEFPTPDEELEQFENEDPGGPDDDFAAAHERSWSYGAAFHANPTI